MDQTPSLVSAQPTQTQPVPPKEQPKKEASSSDALADLTIGLPSPMRLLQESLLLFRHKILNFICTLLIPLILIGATNIIVLTLKANHINQIVIALVVMGTTLMNAFILCFGHLALLFAIKDNEENISILESFKRAKHTLPSYVKILLFVVVIVTLGLLCFGIPGIVFAIWFSAAIFIFLVENLEGIDALLESRVYVQGYWFPVLGRWLFVVGLVSVIYFPLLFITHPIVNQIVLLLLTLITLPVISTYGFLIYGNLRLLKPNNKAVVEALRGSHDTKAKIKLLRPALWKGALAGLPLVVAALYLFVIRPVVVEGNSMNPSFVDGELLVTNLKYYDSHTVTRGDVVIFHSPTEYDRLLIKRIIGLPGEKVGFFSNGVSINTKTLDETDYLREGKQTNGGKFIIDGYELVIPQNQYMVLGDNRQDSTDSRDWGFIRQSDIIGKVGMCLWNCPENK